MRSLNNNYGEIHSLLTEEECYTIGTNDGKEFRRVVYKGTKLLNGKPMHRKEVIKITEDWSENRIKQFKTILKYAGEFIFGRRKAAFYYKN